MSEPCTSPTGWTDDFDVACQRLIVQVLDRDPGTCKTAWRDLMGRVGPHIEQWADQSPILRKCRLATPDDARTVLVDVLERLQANDFANLRRFRERLDPGEPGERADTATLSYIVKLVEEDEREVAVPRAEGAGTVFRAWLLTLVSFAVTDHVRDRLGWRRSEPEQGSKRDVNTHASRLEDHAERGARPAITDFLAMQRFLEQVTSFLETFPTDMKRAIRLWLDDSTNEEIARELSIMPSEVSPLIRAGKARLREHFRGDWDQLRGLGA